MRGMERLPGVELLEGAVDNHVHACPHLNARTVTVFEAVRQAAAAGMRGLGLMDNFCNSAGYAALALQELGDLGVDVFGGLIMEPPAGGVTQEAVEAALGYGYGPGTVARFISLPTHHTRHIATLERRSKAYIESCLAIPGKGDLTDPLPAILDRIAEADVVLNTGHISGPEAVRLVELAKRQGIHRILVPASHYSKDEVSALTDLEATVEFSFFFVSHATQAGLTHVDAESHTVPPVPLAAMVELIRTATPEKSIVNSDGGVFVLPPPVEALREFLLLLQSAGFSRDELRTMMNVNPGRLFRVRR
jgi:NAD(P)-dependent dehydrogenase (short-subunit alcohol dehydrogenase family)